MEIRNVMEIGCPLCGAEEFEHCVIHPNEPYSIKYGAMMHVARIKQIATQKMEGEG